MTKNDELSVNLDCRVGGWFKEFRIKNADTGEVRTVSGPRNMVVDTGLGMFGINAAALTMCILSTNNTPVETTDTVAGGSTKTTTSSTAVLVGDVTNSPRWVGKEISYSFALGGATGVWSSIAIGVNNNNGNLFSRALILNENGDPVTLTIEENEILTVVYQIRLYIPEQDRVQEASVSGVPTEITSRAAEVNRWRGAATTVNVSGMPNDNYVAYGNVNLGPITGSPSPSIRVGTISTSYLDFACETEVSIPYSQGNNPGGIGCIYLHCTNNGLGPNHYQIKFDPPIAKQNTQNLSIKLRHSWGRL